MAPAREYLSDHGTGRDRIGFDNRKDLAVVAEAAFWAWIFSPECLHGVNYIRIAETSTIIITHFPGLKFCIDFNFIKIIADAQVKL